MTGDAYERSIDWEEYWRAADDGDRIDAGPSAAYVLDALREFLDERPPASYADVGCGPGDVVFDVAERSPDATVVGYDAAEPVLAENRERAATANLENVRFERAVLPSFDPGREFDVVSAFYTLCYVADVECALENLYDAVAPGGALVFTYHNRLARSQFRTVAEAPDEHLEESSPFDPERYAERFELVIEGENLLSYERIHDVLGTWPQSVWSVAESAERYPAWRHNPLVYVPE
jgi:SAM-dependent methyltransferase